MTSFFSEQEAENIATSTVNWRSKKYATPISAYRKMEIVRAILRVSDDDAHPTRSAADAIDGIVESDELAYREGETNRANATSPAK